MIVPGSWRLWWTTTFGADSCPPTTFEALPQPSAQNLLLIGPGLACVHTALLHGRIPVRLASRVRRECAI